MSKVEDLTRLVSYNMKLDDVLQQCGLPFIRMYMGEGRPYEVQLGRGRPALFVTITPLPDSKVRLTIMPVGMIKHTSIQEMDDVLLKQRLFKFFKEIS
jgi:hypothetical protein